MTKKTPNKTNNNNNKITPNNTYYSNIPRRKIYEEMLKFEDGIIEMEILLYNEKNFTKYKNSYNKNTFHKMKQTYLNVKSLIIMFLENRKYPKEEDFLKDLKHLNETQKETDKILNKNININKNFKLTLNELNEEFHKIKIIQNLNQGKELFKIFEKFNNEIPKFLEIRRDQIQ